MKQPIEFQQFTPIDTNLMSVEKHRDRGEAISYIVHAPCPYGYIGLSGGFICQVTGAGAAHKFQTHEIAEGLIRWIKHYTSVHGADTVIDLSVFFYERDKYIDPAAAPTWTQRIKSIVDQARTLREFMATDPAKSELVAKFAWSFTVEAMREWPARKRRDKRQAIASQASQWLGLTDRQGTWALHWVTNGSDIRVAAEYDM